MIQNKTPSEILSTVTDTDTYAILCSFLYDLRNVPEYATISELCYMMQSDDLKKFLAYFSGRTIRIPTVEEFNEAMMTLKLYQSYHIEKRPWRECVLLAGFNSNNGKKAKNLLTKLEQTLENYNIGNRQY